MVAGYDRPPAMLVCGIVALMVVACSSDPGTHEPEAPASEEEDTEAIPELIPDPEEVRVVAPDGSDLPDLNLLASQVVEIRQLDVLEPVTLQLVSSAELVEVQRETRGSISDAEEHDHRRERQRALEALHLLPEGVDLDAAAEAMVEVATMGAFSVEREQVYAVAEDGELSPAVRANIAHELVHAIQHQHTDLSRVDDLTEPDEIFAFTAVVEGDAILVEQAWVNDHLDSAEQEDRDQQLARISLEAQGALAEIPPYLLLRHLMPYELGEAFVADLLDAEGAQAIEEVLRNPPTTSVELYNPELYLEGFEPHEPLALVDPGEGWEMFHSSTFGAWQVDMFSYSLPTPLSPLGAGWRGGTLKAWERGDEVVAGFTVTFEDDRALELCERLPNWFKVHAEAAERVDDTWDLERGTLRIGCDERDVQVAVGPDRGSADAILALPTRQLTGEGTSDDD